MSKKGAGGKGGKNPTKKLSGASIVHVNGLGSGSPKKPTGTGKTGK